MAAEPGQLPLHLETEAEFRAALAAAGVPVERHGALITMIWQRSVLWWARVLLANGGELATGDHGESAGGTRGG